jgi:hypothetical protein
MATTLKCQIGTAQCRGLGSKEWEFQEGKNRTKNFGIVTFPGECNPKLITKMPEKNEHISL